MSTISFANVSFANEVKINNFKHLKINVVPSRNTVWVYLNPKPRACITLTLLDELREFQSILKNQNGQLHWKGEVVDIEYHVVTSNHAVFNFGGDLEYFLHCIQTNDKEALRKYAYDCIDTMYPNYDGFDLDITTISLIHGNALGGGFEAAMSSHVLVAEKHANMGLPEVLFNLFPGMGAYNLISQRINTSFAEKMIMSGRLYNAEELYEKGLIDILAESNQGVSAVNSFIENNKKCMNTKRAIRKVRQSINPIKYENLLEICDIWVESAFSITEKDLRTMSRLVRSQQRYSEQESELFTNINTI